jgi:hypothetical protein
MFMFMFMLYIERTYCELLHNIAEIVNITCRSNSMQIDVINIIIRSSVLNGCYSLFRHVVPFVLQVTRRV